METILLTIKFVLCAALELFVIGTLGAVLILVLLPPVHTQFLRRIWGGITSHSRS